MSIRPMIGVPQTFEWFDGINIQTNEARVKYGQEALIRGELYRDEVERNFSL